MGASDWTCGSGRLRWISLPGGKRELQQFMDRDGYASQWMAVPDAGYVPIAGVEPVSEINLPFQQLADAIASHIFSVGNCAEYGRPGRLAFKYSDGGGEREGGGVGPAALASIIREAIVQYRQ